LAAQQRQQAQRVLEVPVGSSAGGAPRVDDLPNPRDQRLRICLGEVPVEIIVGFVAQRLHVGECAGHRNGEVWRHDRFGSPTAWTQQIGNPGIDTRPPDLVRRDPDAGVGEHAAKVRRRRWRSLCVPTKARAASSSRKWNSA